MGRWIAPSSGSGVPDPLPEAAHIRHYAWLDHARICADMCGQRRGDRGKRGESRWG